MSKYLLEVCDQKSERIKDVLFWKVNLTAEVQVVWKEKLNSG